MRCEIKYVASDGTVFTDEYTCIDYEENLAISKLSSIRFYDKDGNRLISMNRNNFISILADSNTVAKIIIPSREDYLLLTEYIKNFDRRDLLNLEEICKEGTYYRLNYFVSNEPTEVPIFVEEKEFKKCIEHFKMFLNAR